MGTGQSQPSSTVTTATAASPSHSVILSGFDVNVTKDGKKIDYESNLDSSNEIQEAYLKGKEDGLKTLNRSFEEVAAKTYMKVGALLY